MPMTVNNGHQALELDVGLILDTYLASEINLHRAKADLTVFFHQPLTSTGAKDLDDYLTILLEQAKAHKLEASQVQADVVRIAGLAQSPDPDFTTHIRRGAD